MGAMENRRADARAAAQAIVAKLAGGLVAAADEYRKFIAAGGDPMELRRYVQIGADMWRTLDDVACRRVDVRVLVLPPRVQSAIRLLPVKEQAKVVENGVYFLAADGATIRIPAAELTVAQARQAIGPDGIRSISAQSAYLKSLTPASAQPKPPPVQFEVLGNKLRIYCPVELSMTDIHRILAQMG